MQRFLDLAISGSITMYKKEHQTWSHFRSCYLSWWWKFNQWCICVFPAVSAKVISYRKYKSIDKEAFLAHLRVSSLVLDPPNDVNHLVDLYDGTLRDIVDMHAPLRTKDMPRSQTVFQNIINWNKDMAHCFNSFFCQKILHIQGGFPSSTLSQGTSLVEESHTFMMNTFDTLQRLIADNIWKCYLMLSVQVILCLRSLWKIV